MTVTIESREENEIFVLSDWDFQLDLLEPLDIDALHAHLAGAKSGESSAWLSGFLCRP